MPGVEIRITGAEEAMRRLAAMPQRFTAAVRAAMSRGIMRVYREANLNITGRALRVQTGRLRQSLQTSVDTDGLSARVGTNVEYAEIHEFGGVTRPHEIRPRGQALAFAAPNFIGPIRMTGKGKLDKRTRSGIIFARVVRHPGAVIPARPYMRPALRDSLPAIQKDFSDEIGKALKETP